MTRLNDRKWGFKKGTPSPLDLHFGVSLPQVAPVLADEIILEKAMPGIYDQLDTSSCTGNGVGRIIQYGWKKAGRGDWTPSRNGLYFNGRRYEGTTAEDNGAIITDVMRGANQYGFGPEKDWPLLSSTITIPPPPSFNQEAQADKIRFYATISPIGKTPGEFIDAIRTCLSHGYPVVFGTQLYEYFGSTAMYKAPYTLNLPKSGEGFLGGHCMVLSGAVHSKRVFRDENSWGPSWADGGRCWISYDYIVSTFTSDLWMVRF